MPVPPIGRTRPELDRWAARVMRQGRIPGLALGLVRGGRTVLARGYGFRDRAHRAPATPDTIFGIASMTKSFTALSILRLQEDRKLRVTDPVVRHLPEFRTAEPRRTSRITLEHFLTHSSGLPPLPSIYYTSGRSIARDPPYDPRVARRVGIDPDHPPIDTYEGLMEFLGTTRYRLLGPPGPGSAIRTRVSGSSAPSSSVPGVGPTSGSSRRRSSARPGWTTRRSTRGSCSGSPR